MRRDERQGPATCDVSVVLCTYNRAALLQPAIDALLSQTGDVSYEIIVVDNNSTDATGSVIREIVARAGGRVVYTFEPQQGLSHARNRGLALARASIIAFTDDDVRVAPDWVQQLNRAFAADP